MKEQSSDPSPAAPGGGFVRSVLTVASGSAAAQLLLSLALPVLARLYTPAEYGVLAVYSAILTVLVVVASLRYESAIRLPREESSAGSLLVLTLGLEPTLRSRSLRLEMGSRGRRRIEEDFDITRVADELTRRFAAA